MSTSVPPTPPQPDNLLLLIPVCAPELNLNILLVIVSPPQHKKMLEGIPLSLPLQQLSSTFPSPLVNPTILVCCEVELTQVRNYLADGDVIGLVRYLRRGDTPGASNFPEPSIN